MPDAIFKGADDRRIDGAGVARDPIEAPESGLRIEESQGKTFEELAFQPGELGGGIRVHIGGAAENFRVLIRGLEFGPIPAVCQSLVEVAIVHVPFAHQKIEIVRRRRRRSSDFQVALVIKTDLRNRNTLIRGQFGLGLGNVWNREHQ